MLRDAVNEIRFHPGRIAATVLAIAISVGFMIAASIFVSTEEVAQNKKAAITTSKADIVVEFGIPKSAAKDGQEMTAFPLTQGQELLSKIDGVTAVDKVLSDMVTLDYGDRSQFAFAYGNLSEPFRWAGLSEGRFPTAADEIALASPMASNLGVKIGDVIQTSLANPSKRKVVGLTSEPKVLVGGSSYVETAGMAADFDSVVGPQWLLQTKPGTSTEQVRNAVQKAMPSGYDLTVKTADEYQKEAFEERTGDFKAMKLMLQAFGLIALVVGMIIIANTFTILVAQRRQRIGLLRAIGASGGQVRSRLLTEAVLLGLMGGILGIGFGYLLAMAGSAYTGALYWGMAFPAIEVLIAIAVGVIITVLAAVGPSIQATRVSPLEALQPVATEKARRAGGVIRGIICGVLVAAGAGLAVWSMTGDSNQILRAIGGASLITLGVLFGATSYVPWLLRGLGLVFKRFGATSRLASLNAVRNPRRAAATAVALMLAIGLIVTLQVGTASLKRTFDDSITARYPVDIAITTKLFDGYAPSNSPTRPDAKEMNIELEEGLLDKIKAVPGVKRSVQLDGAVVLAKFPRTNFEDSALALAYGRDFEAISGQQAPPKGTVLIGGTIADNNHSVEIVVGETKGTFKVKESSAAGFRQILMNPEDLRELEAKTVPAFIALQTENRDDAATVMKRVEALVDKGEYSISGSVLEASMLTQVLDTLLLIVTALLGVAVLIALIGVGNTLGLSVIERRRESALLRALGLQRSSLRWMLTIEAIMLALAGVVVGVIAGLFFGWLGTQAVVAQIDDKYTTYQFSVDWLQTAGLIGLAVVAAMVASILPGRRAAKATPTEALATE